MNNSARNNLIAGLVVLLLGGGVAAVVSLGGSSGSGKKSESTTLETSTPEESLPTDSVDSSDTSATTTPSTGKSIRSKNGVAMLSPDWVSDDNQDSQGNTGRLVLTCTSSSTCELLTLPYGSSSGTPFTIGTTQYNKNAVKWGQLSVAGGVGTSSGSDQTNVLEMPVPENAKTFTAKIGFMASEGNSLDFVAKVRISGGMKNNKKGPIWPGTGGAWETLRGDGNGVLVSPIDLSNVNRLYLEVTGPAQDQSDFYPYLVIADGTFTTSS